MGGAHSRSRGPVPDQGPGPGHSHGGEVPDVEVGALPRILLLGGLVLVALGTVVGLVMMWPGDGDRPEAVQYAAEGTTFPSAKVVSVSEPCPVIIADPSIPPGENEPFPEHCNELTATVDGDEVVVQVPPYVAKSGLGAGDDVKLARIPTGAGEATYGWVGTQRDFPLGAMTLVFVLVVALVARLRGIMALLGLGFAGFVVARFMLPALLEGGSGVGVALVGASAIMFVVLYLTHGLSTRTSTALAGTLVGIGIITALGIWGVRAARLSGVSDEGNEYLMLNAPDLDFRGLLTCAVIIAGLGVLNDVTITQSSAVWELRAAAPRMSRMQLFTSGMRIGRDHIASTIYTIVFAYAGTALAVLMLLSLYDRPLLDTLYDENIAAEVMRTLASAIGLVLAVPATTAIAALTVSGPVVDDRGGRPRGER
ncbi:YibE/F family protein [Nocardioides sp. JQ2195]|uniref:YibE/F family protein n=1 Tax=Nocardioides sp. JQ2195 TaxID=2592334 RepID=UPI00143EED4A|nr:YibE/F family protein [Nocardioides sp. JQ2195]QIX25873.1 YibE/F family protein [Nocardioides sp. JQ2195]